MYFQQLALAIAIIFFALVQGLDSAEDRPTANNEINKAPNTDLIKDQDDPLLLLSTLDGSIYGVGQRSGQIRWKFKDEPVVKVPLDTSKAIVPLFLPDPKDGSLYLLGGQDREALKKLPFTIPQLVASSPCRSSDGIFYTGKKTDTWFSVDPQTGYKEPILSFDKIDRTCPAASADAIFIGRTEYNILMHDSKTKERHWNITFYGYSSSAMETDLLNNYDMVHFSASSTGRTITLDRRVGNMLWEQDYGSPVIAAYLLQAEGLVTVPFTSVAAETLDHLVAQYSTAVEHSIRPADMKLYPTLYIGEHLHGLYALPSLVDENTVTISPMSNGPYLLEGPEITEGEGKDKRESERPSSSYKGLPFFGQNLVLPYLLDLPLTFQSLPKGEDVKEPIIILGHYKVPEYSASRLQIAGRSDIIIQEPHNFVLVDTNRSDVNVKKHEPINEFILSVQPRSSSATVGIQTEVANNTDEETIDIEWIMIVQGNITFILSKEFVRYAYRVSKLWWNKQENKVLKATFVLAVGFIFSMLWYLHLQVREFRQLSQGGSKSSSNGNRNGDITAHAEDIGGGIVRVGKITFNTEEILGKGCEGTFVFRGEFDSRAVAVKRLLPECFTFADREVDLLRESDEHPNVVRYFCTEQDKQFRYIALELCAATLQDFIEGRYTCQQISPLDIVYQATAGLAHLHSLDIVHRDIKPHNVLISSANQKGDVRVMISDFGLCKKLQLGRMSFSRRSGVTGTDGWIAPEMLNGAPSTTCSVDIFSLGCVFYYVLTNGKHPYGDALRRQANILSGETKLTELDYDDSVLSRSLIEAMLSQDPLERPPAVSVLKHPLFWDKAKVLGFFQDVSDRVEKDDQFSDVLQSLETDGAAVLGEDWRSSIDAEVAEDLRKFRNYRGTSVRDLLRALRNKKHHYRELSKEVQKNLGEIPEQFADYWLSRFPNLLLHTWLSMQCVKSEPIFSQYYPKSYEFSKSSCKSRPTKSTGGIMNGWMDTLRKKSPEKLPRNKPKNVNNFWTTGNSPKKVNWRTDNQPVDDRKEVRRWDRVDPEYDPRRRTYGKEETNAHGNRDWRETDSVEKEYDLIGLRVERDVNNANDNRYNKIIPPPGFRNIQGKVPNDWWKNAGIERDIKDETRYVASRRNHEVVPYEFENSKRDTDYCDVGREDNQDIQAKGKKMQKKPKEKNNEVPLVWSLPPTS